MELLNLNQLHQSFFCLSRSDPTLGFSFDASTLAGSAFPSPDGSDTLTPQARLSGGGAESTEGSLLLRLTLASHLAEHVRMKLEDEKGFTCTVGISTSRLLSKLVGNLNKPCGQTTLLPPYNAEDGEKSNVTRFLDEHEIGKVPGIGFTLAQKLRNAYRRLTSSEGDDVEVTTPVIVQQIRQDGRFTSAYLEQVLGGPGSPQGIGHKVYSLLRGQDPSPVAQFREIPRQISIEDTYLRLDAFPDVHRELIKLSASLLRRMQTDLLAPDGESKDTEKPATSSWLARPRTLRLSSRVRPQNSNVEQSYNRSSRSAPLPTFVFDPTEHIEALAARLVQESVTPLFRRLHTERGGWGICLLNIAMTNLVESGKVKGARDIADMFRNQEEVLREWTVYDSSDRRIDPNGSSELIHDPLPDTSRVQEDYSSHNNSLEHIAESYQPIQDNSPRGIGDVLSPLSQTESRRDTEAVEMEWDSDEDDDLAYRCPACGTRMPAFAFPAHARFHELEG